ncbi:MAG: hypothetical protein ACAH80_08100 [Alphaproteobacteria bacterium]
MKLANIFKYFSSGISASERSLIRLGCPYEKKPDGTLVAKGDINLRHKHLKRLPDLSDVILEGSFLCGANQLKSLKGAPRIVTGDFYCEYNQLKSLEHAPQSVGGSYFCCNNQLTDLKGAPRSISGKFACNENNLITLEGAPDVVGDGFICHDNQLTSLVHAPQDVKGGFWCHNNKLETLQGAPNDVGGLFNCGKNKLLHYLHAPQGFTIFYSDLGDFHTYQSLKDKVLDTPAHIEAVQKWKESLYEKSTSLSQGFNIRKPLQLIFGRPAPAVEAIQVRKPLNFKTPSR